MAVNESLDIVRFHVLDRPGLIHGITTRSARLPQDGNVSLAASDDWKTVRRNRTTWSRRIGVAPERLVVGRQVHGTRVAVVTDDDAGRGALDLATAVPGTDALVTATPGLPIAVMSADCTPILLHDSVRQVVGAVHAGWRGTVANVVGEAVRTMTVEFGTNPSDLVAGLGPSIGACCYEVGPEVIEAWVASDLDPNGEAVLNEQERLRFDLWRANTIALISAGVPRDQIELAGLCTRCHADTFFSYRSAGAGCGLFASIIAISS